MNRVPRDLKHHTRRAAERSMMLMPTRNETERVDMLKYREGDG